ncbi:hypothetical protein E2C01_027674 [Portunus trituberculatus]|uniref:Uncharacterized protein n=1 Tax=Portunus trituberculatus TaxID=210409 RepID=A0A5B7EIR0_PORTR|nr:hypothetical protein [Portunus trituberculatus]
MVCSGGVKAAEEAVAAVEVVVVVVVVPAGDCVDKSVEWSLNMREESSVEVKAKGRVVCRIDLACLGQFIRGSD